MRRSGQELGTTCRGQPALHLHPTFSGLLPSAPAADSRSHGPHPRGGTTDKGPAHVTWPGAPEGSAGEDKPSRGRADCGVHPPPLPCWRSPFLRLSQAGGGGGHSASIPPSPTMLRFPDRSREAVAKGSHPSDHCRFAPPAHKQAAAPLPRMLLPAGTLQGRTPEGRGKHGLSASPAVLPGGCLHCRTL